MFTDVSMCCSSLCVGTQVYVIHPLRGCVNVGCSFLVELCVVCSSVCVLFIPRVDV